MRAHVELALAALPQLRSAIDDAVDELVRNFVDDVDALRPAAVLPCVRKTTGQGARGSTRHVRVGAHDHGILAAELQGAGYEPFGAGHRHFSTRRYAAGEADLVDANTGQRRPSFAIAGKYLEESIRQARLAEQVRDLLAAERRDFAGLEQHRIARDERLGGWIHRQDERSVPRTDHADDTERPVVDLQLLEEAHHTVQPALLAREELRSTLRVERQRIAGGENIDLQRLGGRLAGLGDDNVDQIVLLLDHESEHAPENARPFFEGQRRPLGLYLACPFERSQHTLRRSHLDLAQASAVDRGLERESARRTSGCGDGLDDGHDE